MRLQMIIPHSRPTIDKEDIKSVSEVLSSGNISQGRKVKEFEDELARFVGVKHAIAVSSGTSALHIALKSLNIGLGDEVVMPSYVCSSPYLATRYTGAEPRIVDISLLDLNICAGTAKKGMTSKTKAIIVPHMFGCPADLNELLDLGVPVIEDCALSLGAEYINAKVGSFGTISILSFYATKMIATGEGGMILTDDDEISEEATLLREYDKRPLSTISYNYKMTDIQAALGLSQLRKLNHFIERRRQIAKIYDEHFSECNLTSPLIQSHKRPVFYRYIVMIEGLEDIQMKAKEASIFCERPVWRPLHRSLGFPECENTDYAYEHALSIPLYPSLDEKEIEYILQNLTAIFPTKKG